MTYITSSAYARWISQFCMIQNNYTIM